MNICVFCSSSDAVDPVFFDAAEETGRLLARGGHALVYGGASVGLMGAVARAARAEGGPVVSVMPEAVRRAGITFEHEGEIIYTGTLRERKEIMDRRSDAFIALPGGFGTLEEALEIITLKQLGLHNRAVALVNTDGFYDALLGQFEVLYRGRFAKESYRELYHTAPGPREALAYIEAYTPAVQESKWFRLPPAR